jgi:D-glycero-D-manno-heptose 1,7-bisphosphate phosphatase
MESKALFLDRDGVINIEKHYLYKINDFEFIPGIFELCQYYINLGYIVVIITNQSGIARKYYSEEEFLELTKFIFNEFKKRDIIISRTYYCPHHPDINGTCDCRKPSPGMLYEAQKDFNIDLNQSIMIGDKDRDLEAAYYAGIQERILFSSSEMSKYATHRVKSLYELMEI